MAEKAPDDNPEIENIIINNNFPQEDESQWENGQLGTNWFSPPTTSTQISFDLISLEDSSQELIDLSEETLFAPSPHPLYDETNVSETPPPQGELNWSNTYNVTDYLFHSSLTDSVEQGSVPETQVTYDNVEKVSVPETEVTHNNNPEKKFVSQTKVTHKRRSHEKKRKRPALKIQKIEGYTCKLNGGVYQVAKRDLDVLEALENGLKSIQGKIQQQRTLNVRLMCIALSQIETVLELINDDFLDLGMPKELWDEMLLYTKSMFKEVQDQVDLCRKKKFEIVDLSTDELSVTFNQSLNISVANKKANKQTPNSRPPIRIQHPNRNTRKNTTSRGGKEDQENANELSNMETQILNPANDNENDIQIVDSSQRPSPQKSRQRRGRPPGPQNQKSVQSDMSISATQFAIPENFNEPLVENFVSTSTQETEKIADSEAILANASTSFFDETIESWRETGLSFSQVSDSIDVTRSSQQILNNVQSSQIEEIVIEEYVEAPSGNNESTSQDLSSQMSQFTGNKLKNLSKMAMMNFSLRPFVVSGVLSPGKNNMKMNFKDRVYIASLQATGTLEMNGFTFPSIGYWIKSVEGKRFSNFSVSEKKTLNLFYRGNPLENLLDIEENSQKATEPKKKHEEFPLTQASKSNSTSNTTSTSQSFDVSMNIPVPIPELRNDSNLKLVPDEMTRHIKSIFLHAPDEYFPICQCVEQYWNGQQPFPKHLLDELDSW